MGRDTMIIIIVDNAHMGVMIGTEIVAIQAVQDIQQDLFNVCDSVGGALPIGRLPSAAEVQQGRSRRSSARQTAAQIEIQLILQNVSSTEDWTATQVGAHDSFV